MPDQADNLRAWVAKEGKSTSCFCTGACHHGGDCPNVAGNRRMDGKTPNLDGLWGLQAGPDRLTSLPPETAEVYRAKLAGPGLAPSFPALGYAPPSLTDDLITYRRLWLDLKGELEAEADGAWVDRDGGQDVRPHGDPDRATESRRVLDRVLQMETLAFYAHVPPATGETWESVREGLRVKG